MIRPAMWGMATQLQQICSVMGLHTQKDLLFRLVFLVFRALKPAS